MVNPLMNMDVESIRRFTKKLRVRRVTEDSIEDYLRKGALRRKGLAIKIMLLTGWPDRLVLLPGGWVAWVELKRPKGGRFQPKQQSIHARLRSLGFRMYVIHTKEQVDDFYDTYDLEQLL